MLITHFVVVLALNFGSQLGWTWRAEILDEALHVVTLQGMASFILIGAFCLGWYFVLQRMQRVCWVVLSLAGFVLLTLTLQLRMLSARPPSEAMGMILINLPVIFVVAVAIWVWGNSPLTSVSRHGR
jgi:hypothetical protein